MKKILVDFRHIFLNHFVNKIPCWQIRKIIYKIFGLKIGKKSRICLKTIIFSPKNLTIGNNSIINEFCVLDARGGLKIGDNVSISHYTKIITASHNIETFEYFKKSVIINNGVWIGTGAIILEGSQINQNAIIGAGCVFKGIAEYNGCYIGNPSKKIKERQNEQINTINTKYYFR